MGGDPLAEASLLVGKEGNMRRFGLEIPEIRQKCVFLVEIHVFKRRFNLKYPKSVKCANFD